LGKGAAWLRLKAPHINVDPLTKIGPPFSGPKFNKELRSHGTAGDDSTVVTKH
jgi:hypothetical protein